MNRRLDSTTVFQLVFNGDCNPNSYGRHPIRTIGRNFFLSYQREEEEGGEEG